MSLIHLPDDVLFNIFSFMTPPEIIIVRKTCKRLQNLSLERTIWTNAYRNSPYFLPAGPSASQTIYDLEHALVHAYQLDTIWDDLTLLRKRKPRSLTINIPDARYVALYKGKFLAIGTSTTLILYDLHVENEIFRYDVSTKPFWLYNQNNSIENNATFYVPFARKSKNDAHLLQLCICKIDSLGKATIEDIPGIQLNHGCITGIGFDFIAAIQDSRKISLLHIPSQKTYALGIGTPEQSLTNVVFLPGYVLLIFTEYSFMEVKSFQLYPLPDTTVTDTGSSVFPTHCGDLTMHFGETAFLSSDTSIDGTANIWLVVLEGIQLWPLRITLCPDGSMAFHKPDYDINLFSERTMAHGFDLHFTNTSSLSRGRGLAKFSSPRVHWVKYDSRRRADGSVSISMSIIDNDILPMLFMYDFDAYRGLLCGTSENSDKIIVCNLVT